MTTVGILGGGQLGAMLAPALQDLGADVHVYDPDPNAPALRRAARAVSGSWRDVPRLQEFFDACDVVTYEFENVETEGLARIWGLEKLLPSLQVLRTTQNRVSEKEFLRANGLPHVAFADGRTADELPEAARRFGFPSILKTARGGYDGKGQWKLASPAGLDALLAGPAREALDASGWVLEEPIDIVLELSAIVARERNGDEVVFPLFENEHRDHILDVTLVPARLPDDLEAEAKSVALSAARALGVTGLLTTELFVGRSARSSPGQIRIFTNEFAPRPHNSGHVTRKACTFSQFEALARILLEVPLVPPRLVSAGAFCMANLLGEVWEAQGASGSLDLTAWEGNPDLLEVVLYGKSGVAAKRKMGHLTVRGGDAEEAISSARALREAIGRTGPRRSV
ncbi:MAG: 5-(carboxyamino)imidazole ribonucleotide synthase [Holophagales bacterium]|nr:5-(carboxyamino)imidazole ribonucleotide synthase [Holophagales bacterium]